MTKLNYTVDLNKNEEEKPSVKSSMNSLSKQAVINQSLASRIPTNAPMGQIPQTTQNKGFGRTV